jgi:hypothetical protein
MASGGNMVKPLAYNGDAAPQEIASVGYQPRTLLITNMDDGSQVYTSLLLAKHPTVAKRGGLKIDAAGARTWLTAAQGVTLGEDSFTVGSDAACNADGVQYHFVATN